MENLKTLNKQRWDNCKILPNWEAAFTRTSNMMVSHKARYQKVSDMTKGRVPWWFIAIIHHLECGTDKNGQPRWDRSLAQGDPWNRKSTHVPKNRGPFNSWEDAAYDALVNCPPYAARNTDWSIAGSLAYLEKYNGLGYYRKNRPSPYLWSGTNQYSKGKYVADGIYDPNAVSKQLGCAGLLMKMGVFNKPVEVPSTAKAGVAAAGFFGAILAFGQEHWLAITLGTAALTVLYFGIKDYLNYRKNKNV